MHIGCARARAPAVCRAGRRDTCPLRSRSIAPIPRAGTEHRGEQRNLSSRARDLVADSHMLAKRMAGDACRAEYLLRRPIFAALVASHASLYFADNIYEYLIRVFTRTLSLFVATSHRALNVSLCMYRGKKNDARFFVTYTASIRCLVTAFDVLHRNRSIHRRLILNCCD